MSSQRVMDSLGDVVDFIREDDNTELLKENKTNILLKRYINKFPATNRLSDESFITTLKEIKPLI